ncbi:nitroreductase family protein [Pelagicoccus sp. SDUM812002]|uniref:nitroreductase family protein n=1 Tax=Pelagicoccus sp. SDUM812002 TaxID=3041266 RepID=UPI00280E6400|nr:nitroreductase family protein [Pelagicoccus sp. SDUM812002]MDQ8184831.1 nitroreductase family protein [Pelagicoccus sp. SDUM812002]
MQDDSHSQTLADILSSRCTTKAMDERPWPIPQPDPKLIEQILSAAQEAPFHKPAARELRKQGLPGIQPWRCYTLDAKQCRTLRQHLIDTGDTTKIPKLLAVADYLIQVTWLPNPSTEPSSELFDPSIQNMEHIAAASAAIQNMLLRATSLDIPNYWSSGGALRTPEIFTLLSIPESEILLGSLLFFPKDLDGADVKGGSLRPSRSLKEDWSRPVRLRP